MDPVETLAWHLFEGRAVGEDEEDLDGQAEAQADATRNPAAELMGPAAAVLDLLPDQAARLSRYRGFIEQSGNDLRNRHLASLRRALVAEYMLAGWTQAKIAEHLGVGPTVIKNDVRKNMDSWKAAQIKSVEVLVCLEERRLDMMNTVVWPRALAGDYDSVDRVIKISETRRKLLGLDAAIKIDANVNLENADEALNTKLDQLARRLEETAENDPTGGA